MLPHKPVGSLISLSFPALPPNGQNIGNLLTLEYMNLPHSYVLLFLTRCVIIYASTIKPETRVDAGVDADGGGKRRS